MVFAKEEFTVVEAPLLDRLILFKPPRYVTTPGPVRVKIACASNLRALGYLEPMVHKLQINGNMIYVRTTSFSIELFDPFYDNLTVIMSMV